MNALLSTIGTGEQYEGITLRSSTIWCVLSELQNLQSTGDPSECGYLHIPWNISIPTTINEIQYTPHGKLHGNNFI